MKKVIGNQSIINSRAIDGKKMNIIRKGNRTEKESENKTITIIDKREELGNDELAYSSFLKKIT